MYCWAATGGIENKLPEISKVINAKRINLLK
jgi:hypothetical protein